MIAAFFSGMTAPPAEPSAAKAARTAPRTDRMTGKDEPRCRTGTSGGRVADRTEVPQRTLGTNRMGSSSEAQYTRGHGGATGTEPPAGADAATSPRSPGGYDRVTDSHPLTRSAASTKALSPPEPQLTTSVPASPERVSLPEPPDTRSSPAPPSITSAR